MSYEPEIRTFRCPKCGKDYKKLIPSPNMSGKDPAFGFTCPTCIREMKYEEMTPEEKKAAYARAQLEVMKQYWATVSEEERERQEEAFVNRLRFIDAEEWERLEQEAMDRWANKNPNAILEFRKEICKLDARDLLKREYELAKRESGFDSRARSSLSKYALKFCKLFHDYHLDDTYRLVHNDKQERDGYSHRWDYGIYSKEDGQLVMLVDIDATAFHGDFREYDADSFGSHSDFTRQKTIPDHVRGTVIRIKQFWHNFHILTKELQLPYDAFVEERMKQMRFNGFPFPEYRDIELQRSYEDLRNFPGKYGTLNDYTKNAQVGMWLVHHFHPSIYRSHVVGKPSPYEAVQDDVQLRELVENHTLFRNNNDPNKLLQGFDCCEEVPKIHVFSPNHARILIQRYLSEFSTIYDPLCEFSSTLLGAVSLGKRFIGLHYSDVLINESNRLIRWLQSYYPETNAILQQAIRIQAMGEVSCMLTRFPGSQQCIFEQSPMKNTPDEFIRQFMKASSCKRYVFVVPSIEEFRDCVADTIVDRHDPDWKELVVVIDR